MSVKVSKFLSLVLRHEPARIGITLDDAGWTDVGALLAACTAHGVPITRDELAVIVASSDKQRFALSADGAQIRANQGHSVEVDLQLTPAAPPSRLFHGTVAAVLPAIRAEGLVRGQRHHVHLSADVETATRVGGRRGKPVLLTIRADDMAGAGHVFYRSDNGVWLVDHVPPAFIEPDATPGARDRDPERFAPEHPGRGPDHLRRIAIAEQTLAALEGGRYVNTRDEIVELAGAVQAAAEGTVLHELGEPLQAPVRGAGTAIAVTDESTLEAVIRLAALPGGHLACLNFASATHAGGGFLRGAQAQEETLARSSALYPCLQRVPAHYARNQRHGSAYYLDLAVFSPHVPVVRDDAGGWLARPVRTSIVTCAAPNASALRQHGELDLAALEATLRRRAALVLAVAAHHGVARFVLGAWGAGVFGNDPAIVADAFGALLEGAFAGVFAEVVFAAPGAGRPNHDAFAARFADSR
jgi:putative RNA 2'-phosphotransferase